MTKTKEGPDKVFRCVICGREEAGYGHNAQPASDGQCCSECNQDIVIPVRLRMTIRSLGRR